MTVFLRAPSGTQVKLCAQKIRRDELDFYIPAKESFQNVLNVQKYSEIPAFSDGER